MYDHPLSEANANVTALWNAAHSMLADPLPAPPADADASAFQAWTRDVLGPWSQARRAALASIQPAAHQLLADDPRDQLFATVVLSVLYDDFANQIRTIPPPPSIAADSRARDAYREVLAGTVAPLGRLAREGFVRCAELGARVRSPLDSWRAACDAHAQSINEWLPPDASNAPRP